MFWTGGRFVLFGLERKVWASSDGVTWARLPDLPGTGQLLEVTVGERGYVAVGRGAEWLTSAVWASSDGLTWRSVPDQPALHAGAMEAVAGGSNGFVAVGAGEAKSCGTATRSDPVLFAACGARGAAWWSRDGQEWSLTAGAASLPDALEAVGAGRFGYVATAYGDFCESCEAGPPFWISKDGKAWRLEEARTAKPAPSGPGYANAIAVAGSLVVAVGYGQGPTVWSSTDGEHWTARRVATEAEEVSAVTALPSGGIVVVGSGIWASSDGARWVSLLSDADGAGVWLGSVACGPALCIAMGEQSRAGEEAVAVALTGPARATP